MDAGRFDAIARSLTTTASRRTLLGAILGTLVAGRGLPAQATHPASQATPGAEPPSGAEATPVTMPTTPVTVCTNPDRTGLQERAPGDLVAFEELTAADFLAFPPGARAWRVLYVSTGRDNTERTLVCGVVVAPESGPAVATGPDGETRGRVVSWTHGTVGLVHRCQAASNPAALIFGPTPLGINQVSWSTHPDGSDPMVGTVEDGILAGMIGAGWIVTATDYYTDLWDGGSLMPFLIGKIEAANAIDIVRAADHLLTAIGSPSGADAYDVVPWGHSQGGHAAMWTGQLLEPYASATALPDSPTLALAGVVAEAPASVFVAQPGDPGTSSGFGLFDWFAAVEAANPGMNPGATTLFSYTFAAWANYAAGNQPAIGAMPAFPASGVGLDFGTIVTPAAEPVIPPIAEFCSAEADLVGPLVGPFTQPQIPFFVPEMADGPTIDEIRHGNFDQVCAGDPDPALAAWCDWARFNLPGPRGTSPLPSLPRRGNALAPVLIANGTRDVVVHCVATPASPDALPTGEECVSAALYAALAEDYCPDGDAQGHLTLNIWRPETGVVEASHGDIAGLLATADLTTPRFQGSALEQFITAAFEGSLFPGCTAAVVNSGD